LLLADPDKWNQIADIFAGKIRAVIQARGERLKGGSIAAQG
jgi:hypothetical protein